MAKKRLAAVVNIQIPAGQATPAPPVGTALGPHGINIMDFCKAYNAATEAQRGTVIPAEITIYEYRTFSFVTKTPPTPVLIKQAAGLEKASVAPKRVAYFSFAATRSTPMTRAAPPFLPTCASGCSCIPGLWCRIVDGKPRRPTKNIFMFCRRPPAQAGLAGGPTG